MESAPIHSVEDLVGRRLAERYVLEDVIGRGGMSVVFRGQDGNLRRPVAVKVFSDVFGGNAKKLTYRHFVQEAFALSRLQHPNTLRIYDFGIIDHPDLEAPFQVSELLDGGTLRDFIKRKGPQSPEDTIYILDGLCGALSEAHSHDIIHRDVKPTNILFGQAGTQRIVKLSDFSVAQSAVEAAGRTLGDDTLVTQASFYSLGWSAPEQIRGETVDVTADVYGLGLVLGYLLTGERLQRHREVTDFYLDPSHLDASIDQALRESGLDLALAEVVQIACRARREHRYQSVEELLQEMQRVVRERKHERVSPWMEASPLPRVLPDRGESKSLLVLDDLTRSNVVIAGRRFRLFEVSDVFDHELEERFATRPARLRLTFLPSGGATRLHLRGLNCFIRKPSGSMTAGIDFSEDGHIELVSSDRASIAGAHVRVASRGDTHWMLALGDHRVAIPLERARAVACLEVVPGGEAHLFFRS